MITAIHVPVAGNPKIVELPDQNHLTDMQRYVGGWIEAVDIEPGTTLWLNEEGKLEGLDYNDRCHRLVAARLMPGDSIVGDCLITGFDDRTGETTSVNQHWINHFGLA